MEVRAIILAALFALLCVPCAHSLVYSTLELTAQSDSGAPIEGVHFFLECKMTLSSVERHLCISNLSGSCKSACMDCAGGEPASIRAQYGEEESTFEIPSWAGEEACKAYYEPLNSVDAFVFEVQGAVSPPPETEGEGAQENLPENTNIETHDYHLGELEDEDYEYTSYLDELEEDGEEDDKGGTCIGAFILLCACAACFFAESKRIG
ncbi:hypothetical protein JW721_05410 [Candidatus Micrarchaeota archaeon]|nr:hypothetical protein [Candidatus Micrarchaeota archaeon]